jgi:hypothetical protein
MWKGVKHTLQDSQNLRYLWERPEEASHHEAQNCGVPVQLVLGVHLMLESKLPKTHEWVLLLLYPSIAYDAMLQPNLVDYEHVRTVLIYSLELVSMEIAIQLPASIPIHVVVILHVDCVLTA